MTVITHIITESSDMILYFIIVMKNMKIRVKHLNTIKKLLDLENTQDQLYNRICDEHIFKVQSDYQKLAQNQVLIVIKDQEHSMNKMQVMLNNLHSISDVNVTAKVKIYECMLCHQIYQIAVRSDSHSEKKNESDDVAEN
ncbi:hypothetical protein EMCG_07323 [[Emmonsia] crescens]|uniref:Uncharacterized protein n=1 Tax=[Emmonsia] crescens TaxID=73230 RepID=A0A0G2I8P5_9EURO|nr:hypothetical protein EMCG_07323 [Emmonsia crescens UAMH 3008]